MNKLLAFKKAYTSKQKLFLHLAIWLLAVFIFVVTFVKLLDIYVELGDEVVVPKLVQLPLEDALDSLKKYELTYHIQDTQISSILPTGHILFQYPQPGIKVKRKRTIHLVIAAFNLQKNFLPNLSGDVFRTAMFKLNELGISVKDTIWIDTLPFLQVLGVSYADEDEFSEQLTLIEPGQIIKSGKKVNILVGSKEQKMVPVPNLSGVSRVEAIIILRNAELMLGEVHEPESSASHFGIIIKQNPEPFDQFSNQNTLPVGSKVDIWIE